MACAASFSGAHRVPSQFGLSTSSNFPPLLLSAHCEVFASITFTANGHQPCVVSNIPTSNARAMVDLPYQYVYKDRVYVKKTANAGNGLFASVDIELKHTVL